MTSWDNMGASSVISMCVKPQKICGGVRERQSARATSSEREFQQQPKLSNPFPPTRTMEVVVNQSATHQCSLGGRSPKYMLTCAILMTSIHCGRCGTDFTVCVAEDGTVYSWGCNEYGCLGTSRTLDVTCRSCVSYPLLFSSFVPVFFFADSKW